MDKEIAKKTIIGVAKDVIAAIIVVAIIMGALMAYCQVWPPVVVVESGSMSHSIDSQIGVIDTGDMVLVKDSPTKDDIVTYVGGEGTNQRSYGEFGNVIIYKPNGNSLATPIIHRAVLWLEINESMVSEQPSGRYDYYNLSFDAPELGLYAISNDIVINAYGYKENSVLIGIEGIIFNFRHADAEPHSGFVTMGDNNVPAHDQRSGGYMLVKEEWVVGKAIGEIPWFGLIKLSFTGGIRGDTPPNSWPNLFVSIAILIGIPLFLDFGLPLVKKAMKKEDDEDEDGNHVQEDIGDLDNREEIEPTSDPGMEETDVNIGDPVPDEEKKDILSDIEEDIGEEVDSTSSPDEDISSK